MLWKGLLILSQIFHLALTTISINKIVVRVPKSGDIGLIFDLYIVNTANENKEMLEYHIRSENSCCVNITETDSVCDAGKVVGGHFGFINSGDFVTISLIWPTISLYNRVGNCSVIIVSKNLKNEEVILPQTLYFDTRFASLDPEEHTITKNKNYKDCNNWDMDYLNNCEPVNCEERYFGKRNFYNCLTKHCEAVSICNKSNQIYDIFANECIQTDNFLTEKDIENIKNGKFDQNQLNLRRSVMEEKKSYMASPSIKVPKRADASELPYTSHVWLHGLLSGLLIVFATITVYILICFTIFLIVTCVSRKGTQKIRTMHEDEVILNPNSSTIN